MVSGESARPGSGAGPAALPLRSGRQRAQEIAQSYGGLIALLLLILYNVLFNASAFLTLNAIRVNLTQVAEIVIVAVGMTLVIATGGIDLSVGSMMAIAGVIASSILLSDMAPWNIPY